MRRFPKTHAYRRKMSNADTVIMQSFTQRIEIASAPEPVVPLPDPSEEPSVRGRSSRPSSRSRSRSRSGTPLPGLDVFKQGMMLLDWDFGVDFGELPASSSGQTRGGGPLPEIESRGGPLSRD